MDFERPEEIEPIDEFEQELRQAFERRPAPPGLKARILERRRRARRRYTVVVWQRLAASVLVAALVAGGLGWREREERRKGEAAREQVLTALRITNHALDRVQQHLAAHGQPEK